MQATITYFDEPGSVNTSAVLALVKQRGGGGRDHRVIHRFHHG